jgi:polysaccharide biosynthesis protein VpsM
MALADGYDTIQDLQHEKHRFYIQKPGSRVLLLLVFLLAANFSIGLAATTITIKPMVTLTGHYDDNFYKDEDIERDVYTYVVRPGVQIGIDTAKSRTDFSYTLDRYYYNDLSDSSTGEDSAETENYFGHFAYLDTRYVLTERLTLGLRDSFYYTRRVDRYDEYSDSSGRERHWVNRITPRIYYELEDRFAAGLRYRRQDIDYEISDRLDSVEHRFLGDLLYNPSRTKTFDLNYSYWTYDQVDDESDYTSNQIGLAFQQRYKYFTFEAGAGYHWRNYFEPEVSDGDTMTWRFAVGGQKPPSYEIGRRALDTEAIGISSHIFFDYERNFNTLGSFRTDDRFTLSLGHLFWEKIKLILRGYYQLSDYEDFTGTTDDGDTKTREDDVYGISASIKYLLMDQWHISLTAGHTDRDSNVSGYSYDNNFVTLDLEFSYLFGRERRDEEDR